MANVDRSRRRVLGWLGAAGAASHTLGGAVWAQPPTAPPAPPNPRPPSKAAAPGAAGGPQVAKPILSFRPEKGFLDDPFALDPEARRLAVLHTDSASSAQVHLVSLDSGKAERVVNLGDPQRLFERLLLANADGALVVVVRDPTSGKRSAQFYAADGKPLGMVGPVSDFGLSERNGVRLLIGWDRTTNAAGETVHTLVPFKLDGLGRAGRTVALPVSKTGELRAGDLKKAPLKGLGWLDGYTQLIGQKSGGLEPGKDLRAPDRAATFDVLDGKVTWEGEIGDLYGWAAANVLRQKRPQRSLFLVPAEDQSRLTLLDRAGRYGELPLPIPLRLYDIESLQEQEEAGKSTLYFSLSIDPLNPDALSRSKKDTPYLDLFAARIEGPPGAAGPRAAVTHLLRAPLDVRTSSWQLRAPYVAVLRKHQSFSRGGDQIEVYSLK